MIEEQVGVEVGVADFEVDLPPDEREPLAEFEQELFDVVDQSAFEVVFTADVGVADEIEQVRVAGGCCARSESGGGMSAREVGDRATGPFVELSVDVVNEDVAAPALLDSGLARTRAAGRRRRASPAARCGDATAIVQRCVAQLPGRATLRRRPACT